MEATRAIICMGCGRTGAVLCEKKKLRFSPVSVSQGFYLRMPKSRLGDPRVACEKCDTDVPISATQPRLR